MKAVCETEGTVGACGIVYAFRVLMYLFLKQNVGEVLQALMFMRV